MSYSVDSTIARSELAEATRVELVFPYRVYTEIEALLSQDALIKRSEMKGSQWAG